MSGPSALRDLDDRIVPRLQVATRRGLAAAASPFLAAHRREREWLGGRPYRFVLERRVTARIVVVLLALAGSAVHFDRYPDVVEARAQERADALRQSVRQPQSSLSGDLPAGAILHGPEVGQDPSRYVADRHAELAAAADAEPRLAVVSLAGYLSADEVEDLLDEAGGFLVLRAQYRLPDVEARPLETDVVDGDLEGSFDRILAEEREAIVEEERALEELLASGTMQDEAFEADARNRIDELRTIRNVLDATGAIAFAVVVRADVDDLRALVELAGIRLVDLLPAGADEDDSILFGLRPDDVGEVTFGVTPRG